MSKAKRTKNKDQLSVSDFKQWLSGVEDMQPDGWTPNAEQWKKIRSKIDMISEEQIVEEQQPDYTGGVPQYGASTFPNYAPAVRTPTPSRAPSTIVDEGFQFNTKGDGLGSHAQPSAMDSSILPPVTPGDTSFG